MHTQDGVSLTPSSGGLHIAAQLRGKECQWNGIIFLLLGHSPKVPALEGSALENCQLLQAVLLGGSVCHGPLLPQLCTSWECKGIDQHPLGTVGIRLSQTQS